MCIEDIFLFLYFLASQTLIFFIIFLLFEALFLLILQILFTTYFVPGTQGRTVNQTDPALVVRILFNSTGSQLDHCLYLGFVFREFIMLSSPLDVLSPFPPAFLV